MTQSPLIPLSPALVLSSANTMLGLHEARNGRGGEAVETMLQSVGQPSNANWGAAFLYHVGWWAHYDHRSATSLWPFPRAGTFREIGLFAGERGILSSDGPELGDIALKWRRRGSRRERTYVHGGFVAAVIKCSRGGEVRVSYRCEVIEGNIDAGGNPGGPGIYRVRRTFRPALGDRFVKWVHLDGRRALNDPKLATTREMGRTTVLHAA